MLFVFLLLLPLTLGLTFSDKFPNCKTTYSYAKVCHHYKFENDNICVPWNLTKCPKIRTTYHQTKCPKYECVVTRLLVTSSTALAIHTTKRPTTTTTHITTTNKLKSPTTTRRPLPTTRKSALTTTRHTRPATTTTTTVKSTSATRKPRHVTASATSKPRHVTSRHFQGVTNEKYSTTKQPPTTAATTTNVRFTSPFRKFLSSIETPLFEVTEKYRITTDYKSITTTTTTTTKALINPFFLFDWQHFKIKIDDELQLRQQIVIDLEEEKQLMKKAKMNRADFNSEGEGVDCGTKQCFLEFHFLSSCTIYIPTNNTDCNIPCTTSGCRKEIHHLISCPTWYCTPHSTTTSTSTTTKSTTTSSATTTSKSTTLPSTTATTSTTPTTTLPSTTTKSSTTSTSGTSSSTTTTTVSSTMEPPSVYPNTPLIVSLSVNLFLAILVVFFVQKKIRKAIRNHRQQENRRLQQQRQYQHVPIDPIIRQPLLSNTDHYFTLTSRSSSSTTDETVPLLIPSATTPNPRATSHTSTAVSARSTTGWSWSDISLTPPHSALHQNSEEFTREQEKAAKNFLKMSTFKPTEDETRRKTQKKSVEETIF